MDVVVLAEVCVEAPVAGVVTVNAEVALVCLEATVADADVNSIVCLESTGAAVVIFIVVDVDSAVSTFLDVVLAIVVVGKV